MSIVNLFEAPVRMWVDWLFWLFEGRKWNRSRWWNYSRWWRKINYSKSSSWKSNYTKSWFIPSWKSDWIKSVKEAMRYSNSSRYKFKSSYWKKKSPFFVR